MYAMNAGIKQYTTMVRNVTDFAVGIIVDPLSSSLVSIELNRTRHRRQDFLKSSLPVSDRS